MKRNQIATAIRKRLKWEHDVEDGGAGGLGVIDGLQLKIARA